MRFLLAHSVTFKFPVQYYLNQYGRTLAWGRLTDLTHTAVEIPPNEKMVKDNGYVLKAFLFIEDIFKKIEVRINQSKTN